ncbi:MAG: hypothetical protein OEW11_08160 [Nitrospirota bacterium]|nr:hypothetical protein [Nitrospirota bacterium]
MVSSEPFFPVTAGRRILALLRLRRAAGWRRLQAQALPLLVLGPLIGGTALLFLGRLGRDARVMTGTAALEPLGWIGVLFLAMIAVRRAPVAQRPDLVALHPLGGARRVDAWLAALGRVAPLCLVVAVIVAVTGGGGTRWVAVAVLLLAAPLLAPTPAPARTSGSAARRATSVGPWPRRLARLPERLPERLVEAPLRPHLRRDLLLLLRGAVPGAGVSVAGCALSLLVVCACSGFFSGAPRPRLALLAGALAGWGLATAVFPLTRSRWRRTWVEAAAGVPPRIIWRSRVALGGVLGGLAGCVGGLVWLGVDPVQAWRFPLFGLAAGILTGAAVMEGDGRPLLAAVVALIPTLLIAALGVIHPLGLLAVFLVVGYLEKLAEPRIVRRLGEPAAWE